MFWTDACRGLPYRTKWHRKCIIVDGHTAIIGGSNLLAVPLSTDMDALVQGECAQELQAEFCKAWRQMTDWPISAPTPCAGLAPPEGFDFAPWTASGVEASVLASTVGASGSDPVLVHALRLIAGARKTVRIAMGFSAFTAPVIDAVAAAIERGVSFSFVGNSYTSMDLKGPQLDQARSIVALLTRCPAAEVWLTHGDRFLHGKYVVADGEAALFGSWNMWPRSHFYEHELDLCVWDATIARELEARFEAVREEFCNRAHDAASVAVGVGCPISCTWGLPLW